MALICMACSDALIRVEHRAQYGPGRRRAGTRVRAYPSAALAQRWDITEPAYAAALREPEPGR